ncbi:hydrogenase-4 component E [Sabulicella glaciei]|uniref:Hydrogenase-4 component E n=1 Tax=Sabulicella glaciei TaxID=2984948 RepID=A0ABT3NSB8_9PROT|nr:hydrogenase-4 component E [Roseococcus sp. MDT2-1-1]MCW8085056.1 hydrogenase-4 component E [Roseococcus sp. MDT2-1-1]
MGFGQLPYDVAHLLGGAMLLCSFVMLYQRRLQALVTALAAQGVLLGLAALWQGHVQGAPSLYLTGLIALAAKGVAIPLVLRRLLRQWPPEARVEDAPVALSLLLGLALVGLSLLVALPVTAGARAMLREDLAVALSLLLIGLVIMATRRLALAQVAGLMTLENGLVLAATGVAGMPFVVEISTAGLVLVIALLAGVLARQIHGRWGSLDTALLDPHRGR